MTKKLLRLHSGVMSELADGDIFCSKNVTYCKAMCKSSLNGLFSEFMFGI